MKVNDYSEKKIRATIIKKIKPRIQKGRKHDKGKIFINEILVARVKLPNSHPRIMKHSRSQFIASDLQLNSNEFNNLIDCPMKGPAYLNLLKERV